MEEILRQRGIDSLYHFTRAENLSNIFEYGLLPRETLSQRAVHSSVNDPHRLDGCQNAVCTSIEFPNYKMFFKLRQDNPDTDWAVLRLDAQILCDYHCAFCWTNAGDSSMFNSSLEERMRREAFLGLFENRPSYPNREDLNIGAAYPTNPQAEVLVFGTISTQYIKAVYFVDRQTLERYENVIPNIIDAKVNETVFKPQRDWRLW